MSEVKIELSLRPPHCEFDNLSDLYALYEEIFLRVDGHSVSWHEQEVLVFDHHFFHLAALRAEGMDRLFMLREKDGIRKTVEGFGKFTLEQGGSRARHLPSAKEAMIDPDEVWERNPTCTSARWVCVKEFDSLPYPFTVALLVDRPEEGGIIVPVSSFPCKRRDVRRWRRGQLVFKRKQPPEDG